MLYEDSPFCQELQKSLLEGAPCSFTLDGRVMNPAISVLERAARWDVPGGVCWQKTARLDGLTLTLRYWLYGSAVRLGLILFCEGPQHSGLIENVEFARMECAAPALQDGHTHYARLLYNRGSDAKDVDFAPLDEPFFPETTKTFTNRHGRSCEEVAPYFNFDFANGTGVIAAIGWSGHWQAQFRYEAEMASVVLQYPDAAFRLKSGESVELPQALVLPWHTGEYRRDLADSFNAFRRLMRKYIQPRPGGKEFHMPVVLRAWGSTPPEGHAIRLQNAQKHGLTAASYGIDAGWYQLGDDGKVQPNWWTGVGDWQEAAEIFPQGIGALAYAAKQAGMGFWLWVELERAVCGSDAVKRNPEFYLHNKTEPNANLVDLGNPEASAFLLQKICRLIDETQMNIFRIDYNIDPADLFAQCDAKDRRGMTELCYYNGLYALFEELLLRYPQLVIDNCGAGGRRLDWRLCGCAIPIMCSSDYFTAKDYDPEGIQGHTWGLGRWIPISGDSGGSCTGATKILMDTNRVRSSMRSCLGLAAPDWELSEEEAAWYRKMFADAEAVAPYMSMDAYPLTGYTLSPLDWFAFQRCAEDGSRGMVVAFRRADAADAVRTFALRGLQPEAKYRLTDLDDGDMGVFDAESLAVGLSVCIPQPRSARILFLEKA